MANKNETPALILSLLVTLALIGAGAWWFVGRFNVGNVLRPSSPTATAPDAPDQGTSPGTDTPIAQRLSLGQQVLFPQGASEDKTAAVAAIANQNYSEAVRLLEASLQQNSNDPEALIYLNNARIGDGPSYTIAVSVPAGTVTNVALEILRGVAQAQNQVNQAGGINGTPLRVLIASDDDDLDTVKTVARSLVDDSKVLAVIGHFSSNASLAAAPIYNEGKLVMISPTSTSIQLSGQGNYIFRTVPSDRFTATALSRHLMNTGQQRNVVVFFNGQSDYSISLKNEFSTAFATDGGQILSEVDITGNGFDPGNAVKAAQQQQAEALVLLTNSGNIDTAIQMVAVNRRQLPLVGGDGLYSPKLLQIGGANSEGMVVTVPWIIQANAQSPFTKTARQLWGGDINWRTATAYDAVIAIVEGLRANPTREGIDTTLRNSSFAVEGATGSIRFLASGDRNLPMQLVKVAPGSRSGFGYDFVPAQ
ncbi:MULTISPECIES: ABC transporter substrate-binding protein [unclassified Leptolyngbya]|uniref:ABC transporter substrate-binding protein n=1 Tax=unclassified Leptolyngbya TaxID=2650499 RepID=UPI00168735E3|nr:amino acid ABC transporter substrate-binding protein [Leptolyngbya sp. FACHB-8]MBD2153702.1 amino acid ABC transporter substrate-binding protein [Leptolyngbya sp. FACHB-16]